ncbi:DUF2318 domain-containing protein [Desulfobacula sp.]|uniref:DUF2318 domain-containing protein n=1 Tax=Desulfobacula sp. TaxID=2593537 RepID=UPI0025BD2692|nr:DUF2318 domain-containing protein [Desulfobacula sp.]
MMKLYQKILAGFMILLILLLAGSNAYALFGSKFKTLKPKDGNVYIPINEVNDGKAHYFKTKSDDGTLVDFFLVQSTDGVIRAAIDSCDVCYRSGKGYVQDGNVMVCTNCGRRFATDRINEVKGGCNPAPLMRVVDGDNLVISMQDINTNAWYCKYK